MALWIGKITLIVAGQILAGAEGASAGFFIAYLSGFGLPFIIPDRWLNPP
jgi:hypothetical protein